MVDGLLVEVFGIDDLSDDDVHEALSDLIVGDFLGVLGGDNDGVNSLGDNFSSDSRVFDGDLGLDIGSQPGELSVVSDFADSLD